MRLCRENLALKVQLDALVAEVTRVRGKKARVSLGTRAAQVWAYLVTRGNPPFQKHHLSAAPRTIQRWATKLLHESRVAHLATTTKRGAPHNVPICYAFDGKIIYTPIDRKPKRVIPQRLRRIRNISGNPAICLVVDAYYEDWSRLRYVIVHGSAEIIYRGAERKRAVTVLRRKYGQYRKMHIEDRPVIRITPSKITAWKPDLEL